MYVELSVVINTRTFLIFRLHGEVSADHRPDEKADGESDSYGGL